MRYLPLCAVLILGAACHHDETPPVTTPPQLISGQSSIPYPTDLYAKHVEGEVMLYLLVDSSGNVVRDSSRVVTTSGQTAFDAAALEAAPRLRFNPAHRGTVAIEAPIQVPIRFTLPDSVKNSGKPR